MGDPKKQGKKFETPRFPWRTDILAGELKIVGQYGLRNKRELWRHKSMLSKFRSTARSLLGMSGDQKYVLEGHLIGRLKRIGILSENAVLDNVLDMSIEDILELRLQTIVFRRNLSSSVQQARQFIVHGHIAIHGKKVSVPSYLVLKDEEDDVSYSSLSPFSDSEHPLRKETELNKLEEINNEQEK